MATQRDVCTKCGNIHERPARGTTAFDPTVYQHVSFDCELCKDVRGFELKALRAFHACENLFLAPFRFFNRSFH